MKKIWSILLTVILVVATFATVPVSAAYVETDDIAISTELYDVTVTVETTVKGTMTAMITNTTNLHGIKSNRTPDSVLNASNEVIGYKYVFNFRMLETDPTAVYTVNIGFRGQKTEKTFSYAGLDDKVRFYDTLNTTPANGIKAYFDANPLLVPVELNVYNALATNPNCAAAFGKVNDNIVALDLATGVVNTDTTQQKLDKLAPVDARFTSRFAELMNVASIVTTTESDWAALTERLLGTTFDNHYYDPEVVDTAYLTAADVYPFFQTEAGVMTDYTMAECSQAFDKATLAAIEDKRSVGILKDAFAYFISQSSISPDTTYIDQLIAAGKDTELWQSLRLADNTNCDTLVTNAENIAYKMVVEDKVLEESGSGSTDGTTGGTIIDRPTGGGGGGGYTPPTKPTEPETPDTPVAPTGSFTDIASVEWAKESIEALADKGILLGKGEGKFVPNDSVTREEFVKIIVAAFELSEEGAECDFSDVAKDSWSYPYIAAANKLGIVSGTGTSFNPKSGISRQDMAVIIHRVFEHLGLEVSGDAINFNDNADIAEYAKDAVETLTAAGIINGMGDGKFVPKGTVTRAQAAKVVYGLLGLVGGGK